MIEKDDVRMMGWLQEDGIGALGQSGTDVRGRGGE